MKRCFLNLINFKRIIIKPDFTYLNFRNMRVISLLLLLSFFLNFVAFSQPSNKFQKKINGYLSKDEVEKAENFCSQLKSEQERSECYSFMGDKALEEMDYVKATHYFRKSKSIQKQYKALLEAVKNGEQQAIDNYLIREAKGNNSTSVNNAAFMPIADLCYKQKDYKNAGYYYEKANISQLSAECKVLHAINTTDYITVVEISEKENIGLRNTLEVYKHAADEYFIKGDYSNAGKCYKKIGDKAKMKLCFLKEVEVESTKALAIIKSSKFAFSDKPFEIEKKLAKINAQIPVFENVALTYKQSEYLIKADSWALFSKQTKDIIEATKNGVFLIKSKDKNVEDGNELLEEGWRLINTIASESRANLTIQQQEPIKNILKEISLLEVNYNTQVRKMASKQLTESGIISTKTVYQFPKAAVEAQNLIDDYFLSINAKQTPKVTAWLIFGIVQQMHNKIIKA